LERYSSEFELWDKINLDSKVVRVEKGTGGKEGHVVFVQRKGEKGAMRKTNSDSSNLQKLTLCF